ncbi:hypothetical protein G6F56_009412 [Rhizopus delemar]|nr:hypothetical protein G6F56_009412 [Rhizopus delemar]
MNPHSLQANPYSYNQNFTTDLTPELINSVSNQQNNIDNRIGSTNSPQPMFDPQSIATMMAKRQVYSGNSMLGMSSSSIENTSAMTSLHSPQNQNVSQQSLLLQQVRNSQAFQRMDEQQKLQYLMLQKQNIKEKDTAETKKSSFTLNDTELNSKRVEAILEMNQEIIRLLVESKNTTGYLEPDLAVYQAKLQSNLTFLATMADISMVKAGEEVKVPAPPDLTPFPPAKSDIRKKIQKVLNNAIILFENYPQSNPQQLKQQLQQSSRVEGNNLSSAAGRMMADPQFILRQQMQQQQMMIKHMSNNQTMDPYISQPATASVDLLNGITNPVLINPNNNTMLGSNIYTENTEDYANLLKMM